MLAGRPVQQQEELYGVTWQACSTAVAAGGCMIVAGRPVQQQQLYGYNGKVDSINLTGSPFHIRCH